MINKLIKRERSLLSPQSIEEFEFIEGSRSAIADAENEGLKIYVISNQPDVSKDWRSLNEEKLREINDRLIEEGVEKVYNCTHGPLNGKSDKTYTDQRGEIITCDCRKPQPGLIAKCFKENNLSLNESIIVGDSKTDILAAERFEGDEKEEFRSKIKIGENLGLCDKNMACLKNVVEEVVR